MNSVKRRLFTDSNGSSDKGDVKRASAASQQTKKMKMNDGETVSGSKRKLTMMMSDVAPPDGNNDSLSPVEEITFVNSQEGDDDDMSVLTTHTHEFEQHRRSPKKRRRRSTKDDTADIKRDDLLRRVEMSCSEMLANNIKTRAFLAHGDLKKEGISRTVLKDRCSELTLLDNMASMITDVTKGLLEGRPISEILKMDSPVRCWPSEDFLTPRKSNEAAC